MEAQLSTVIYGDPGVGKSRLAATAPAPRLVLDVEGSFRFIGGKKKIKWDPLREDVPPAPTEGEWTTCVVNTLNWATFEKVFEVLRSGQHPFQSLVIDTLTELQKRLVDEVAPGVQPTMQDWGTLLRTMDDNMRRVRDLLDHPNNPLSAVVLVAHGKLDKEAHQFGPLLKGQIANFLPGHFDVIGYMFNATDPETGEVQRKLLITPAEKDGRTYVAKDRTGILSRGGPTLVNPDISRMLDVINQTMSEED